MIVQVSPKIRERESWSDAVGQASAILISAADDMRHKISANWDVAQDEKQRPLLTLELSDPWGSVKGDFAPEELKEGGDRLWFRIHRLWRSLLGARMDKLLRELNEEENGAA